MAKIHGEKLSDMTETRPATPRVKYIAAGLAAFALATYFANASLGSDGDRGTQATQDIPAASFTLDAE